MVQVRVDEGEGVISLSRYGWLKRVGVEDEQFGWSTLTLTLWRMDIARNIVQSPPGMFCYGGNSGIEAGKKIA